MTRFFWVTQQGINTRLQSQGWSFWLVTADYRSTIRRPVQSFATSMQRPIILDLDYHRRHPILSSICV